MERVDEENSPVSSEAPPGASAKWGAGTHCFPGWLLFCEEVTSVSLCTEQILFIYEFCNILYIYM